MKGDFHEGFLLRNVNFSVNPDAVLYKFTGSKTQGSLLLSSYGEITGSSINTFAYDDIASVSVEPSGSSAKVEYFIATT